MIDFIEVRVEPLQQVEDAIRILVTVKVENGCYKTHQVLMKNDFLSNFDLLWDEMKQKIKKAALDR